MCGYETFLTPSCGSLSNHICLASNDVHGAHKVAEDFNVCIAGLLKDG